MIITDILLNLNKNHKINIESQNFIIDIWNAMLGHLELSNTVIPRNGLKSVNRTFHLSRKMICNRDDTTLITHVHDIDVLRGDKISKHSDKEIDRYVKIQDDFSTLVYGKSLGKRIIKIWTKYSDNVVVFAKNSFGDVIGVSCILYMNVKGYKVAYINGLAVHPELTRSGVGSQLVTKIFLEIRQDAEDKDIDAIVFGIEDGNNIMFSFIGKYIEEFLKIPQNKIETYQGKSVFLPTTITVYWVNLKNAKSTDILPSVEEIDDALLETAKIATEQNGNSVMRFYMLAGSHFLRTWFHRSYVGQMIQQM
jgi:GNAT superfamily N-acetyltransferase